MRAKHCLTNADIGKIMAACKEEATKNKWKVSIAIVDDGGALVNFERMEGAMPQTAAVATGKANTASVTGRSTKMWEDRAKELFVPLNLVPIQGGLPIMYQNECVGAVGVAGGLAPDDEKVAQAGLSALA